MKTPNISKWELFIAGVMTDSALEDAMRGRAWWALVFAALTAWSLYGSRIWE